MPALEEAKTMVLHHPSQQRISFQTTVGHENSKGWTGLRTSMQSSSLVFGYQNDVKQKKKDRKQYNPKTEPNDKTSQTKGRCAPVPAEKALHCGGGSLAPSK